jgi:hypothetical protein
LENSRSSLYRAFSGCDKNSGFSVRCVKD